MVRAGIAVVLHNMSAARSVGRDEEIVRYRPMIAVGLCRNAGVVIPTCYNGTVMRVPLDGSSAMYRQRMREIGWRLEDGCLKDPPLLGLGAISRSRPLWEETSDD